MSLRILVGDTYYDTFLAEYERDNADATCLSYAEQHARLMGAHFGTGDALATGFGACGCEAETIVLNAGQLQRRWAAEHGAALQDLSEERWDPAIFVSQVRDIRPDVLFVQELSTASDDVLAAVKPFVRLMVGQIACSLPKHRTFASYDLLVSSWQPMVDYFRRRGLAAEWCPLGFDSSVLPKIANEPKRNAVTFVGGLSEVHQGRIALLEHVCRNAPVEVYGYGVETLSLDSPIRRAHGGQAWGLEAYRILAGSAITLNVHGTIDVPGHPATHLANNCRLYEATGVGTLLVTDWKENLGQLFEPGVEVVTYADAEQCVERIKHFLENADERSAIAAAGQRRTLSEHTYEHRTGMLVELFGRTLSAATAQGGT